MVWEISPTFVGGVISPISRATFFPWHRREQSKQANWNRRDCKKAGDRSNIEQRPNSTLGVVTTRTVAAIGNSLTFKPLPSNTQPIMSPAIAPSMECSHTVIGELTWTSLSVNGRWCFALAKLHECLSTPGLRRVTCVLACAFPTTRDYATQQENLSTVRGVSDPSDLLDSHLL